MAAHLISSVRAMWLAREPTWRKDVVLVTRAFVGVPLSLLSGFEQAASVLLFLILDFASMVRSRSTLGRMCL